MILVFGSINIDLVTRVASIPRPGETVLSPRYETLFGGKGANQAVAAARASLPRRVTIAACVGDDAFGRSARDNLIRNGVGADLVANSTEPTGCAFITVDEHGENAITVASGANAMLTEASIRNFGIDASTVAVLQMEVPFPGLSASPGRFALSAAASSGTSHRLPQNSRRRISRISSMRPISSSSMSTRLSQRRHSSGARRPHLKRPEAFCRGPAAYAL